MNKIILVGAGGAGVSSLGGLLLALGYTNVIAVNNADSPILQGLGKQGATVIIGHGKYEVQQGDIVIYSAAALQSEEVQQAFALHEQDYKKNPPPMLFHECMGEISKYFCTIAVTGTHGKSSTSAMMAATLEQLHPDFGVAIIGAQLTQREGRSYGLNHAHQDDIRTIFDHIFFRKGQNVAPLMKQFFFVIEADEFNKHFLFQDPDYAIITTCELDHLDTYGTEANYFKTFYQFMQRVKKEIYIPANDQGINKLLTSIQQYPPLPTPIKKIAHQQFNFSYLLGGHNHANASLVHACCQTIGIEEPALTEAINSFRGIKRRAELLGKNSNNIPVYSDYGHHPTELTSTIAALRDTFPEQPIHILFEPHQMARIVQFREEFQDAMKPGNTTEQRAYVPIYAARESIEGCRKTFPQDGALGPTKGIQQLHKATTSKELSSIFAQQNGAPLLENNKDILDRIASINTGIIVFFSAGKLDGVVRTHMQA